MAISDRIAVMNRGAIVQLDRAEELYRRPASTFVARFIGRTNLLDAVVTAVGDGHVDLDVAGWVHRVECGPGQAIAGTTARIVVRPETVTIGPPGGAGSREGVVTARTYLGDKIEYEVEIGPNTLQVVEFNPGESARFDPGARVGIRLPSRGIQFLAGDGQ